MIDEFCVEQIAGYNILPQSAEYNAGKLILKHHLFQDGEWKLKLAQPHPTVKVTMFTHNYDYERFKITPPPSIETGITAIVDSGAQCCVWSWSACQAAGFTRKDLIPVKQKLNAVSKSQITIHGALLLRLRGLSGTGEEYSAAAIVYISPDVNGFYMSQDVMIQLCIVPREFPAIGGAKATVCSNEGEEDPSSDDNCPCYPRSPPPGRPDELPMTATVENIPKMKQYLLDRYKESVFNQCTHQPTPKVKGPPMRIHVDPDATPTVATTPVKCPLYWEAQTKNLLKTNQAMGNIEPVPEGEVPKWIHKMLTTRKPNGDLRLVVDLSPLNKHCQREIHATQSPFELAKGIPPNTWRTVTDAWNGFHTIPLHEDDRHLTTFLSPFGHRYRYRVAPQGYASSGDGFNRRCDEIFSEFERLKRCVDDSLIYDDDDALAEHWWRTIDFLECCARNGIILNPSKFQ